MTTADTACQKMAKGPINEKYQLICAASLKDEEYLILQNDPKCEKIILFCQKEERAKLLRNNFSKITSAQYNFEELT
jgi:hypothetical protein